MDASSEGTRATNPDQPDTPLSDVQKRLDRIDYDTCMEWGGQWENGCELQRHEFETADHSTPTIVRSPEDALAAFETYTEWFHHVIETHEPTSESCILLPCGATKPIGSSSIHQKKVNALKETGFHLDADIMIISEPCTVVPHTMRLSRPAVNYDFPPEFTKEDVAPRVFEEFTDRIASFIDAMPYTTYYPYLVKGHQEKFDAALQKAQSTLRVVRIPGSSFGVDSHNLSGDLFKSREDITTKLEMVRALADADDPSLVSQHPDAVVEFYQNRPEYQPVE